MDETFKELLPIKDQIWDETTTRLVSISCIAYNQDRFIRETLDGFLNQRTSFAVEILIHDDASTDRTADIIREYEERYPHIVKPIYQTENQYRKGIKPGMFNLDRAKGIYYATCEGDDYWDDPFKLQLQVDFLESNPDYSLVYTNFRKFNQNTGEFKEYTANQIEGIEDLLTGNSIGTLTVCTKLELLKEFYRTDNKELPHLSFGDYQRWLYLITKGRFKHLDRFSAIYRVLENSASHSANEEKIVKFSEDIQICKEFFINKYLPGREDLRLRARQVKLLKILNLAMIHSNRNLFKRYASQTGFLKDYNNKRLVFILYIAKFNFSLGSWLFRLRSRRR